MVRVDSISDLTCAPLTRLENYWQDLRGGRLMPARADIDPTSIQASGADFTGRYLDELNFASETDTDWSAIHAELVREKRPIASRCVFRTASDDFTYRVGVFPLCNDDNRVDHTIAYEHLNAYPGVAGSTKYRAATVGRARMSQLNSEQVIGNSPTLNPGLGSSSLKRRADSASRCRHDARALGEELLYSIAEEGRIGGRHQRGLQ